MKKTKSIRSGITASTITGWHTTSQVGGVVLAEGQTPSTGGHKMEPEIDPNMPTDF